MCDTRILLGRVLEQAEGLRERVHTSSLSPQPPEQGLAEKGNSKGPCSCTRDQGKSPQMNPLFSSQMMERCKESKLAHRGGFSIGSEIPGSLGFRCCIIWEDNACHISLDAFKWEMFRGFSWGGCMITKEKLYAYVKSQCVSFISHKDCVESLAFRPNRLVATWSSSRSWDHVGPFHQYLTPMDHVVDSNLLPGSGGCFSNICLHYSSPRRVLGPKNPHHCKGFDTCGEVLKMKGQLSCH